MGYSARYHAASLIAVFIALSAGILIGAEFGGDVITSTREGLERSLEGNLEESRERIDELDRDLDRHREFGRRVYPALVGDRLDRAGVGVVALGSLSDSDLRHIEAALEPTGAEILASGVVRLPPRTSGLARAVAGSRYAALEAEPELLGELAEVVGAQVALGGGALQSLRGEIFSRVSGRFGGLDYVVVLRDRPESSEGDDLEEERSSGLVEVGLMRGLVDSGLPVVGVESSASEHSSIPFFDARNVASVDNIDQVAGRLSLVLSMLGAQGNFGVKETADNLMPDVITGLGPAAVGMPVGPGAGRVGQ